MSPLEPLVSAMEVLHHLGWVPDTDNPCSTGPALKYSFGNLTISAGVFTNRFFQPVVILVGLFSDGRSIQDIAFEIPQQVESRLQMLAFVAYALRGIRLAITPEWLEEGQRAQGELPWVRDAAAYRARPLADVTRDWMRVFGRELRSEAAAADESDHCRVAFDGEVLRFLLPRRTLPVAACGEPWKIEVTLELSALVAMPKRWMSDPVAVAFWKGHLTIGNQQFNAIAAETRGSARLATQAQE
ncbi:MAG: hypothetical protein ABI247_10855 [Rhodanobacter sp.]